MRGLLEEVRECLKSNHHLQIEATHKEVQLFSEDRTRDMTKL